jgi:hypothetical protein
MKEHWKTVEGFEAYEVSDLGNVKSLERTVTRKNQFGTCGPMLVNERILKPNILRKGYLVVRLYKGGKKGNDRLVHVLVARAFIPNPLGLTQVNHLGDNGDCRVCMLEWRSEAGNMQHAVKTGRKAGDGVSFNKKAKKWRAGYCSAPNVRVYLGEFDTREEALAVRKAAVEALPYIL